MLSRRDAVDRLTRHTDTDVPPQERTVNDTWSVRPHSILAQSPRCPDETCVDPFPFVEYFSPTRTFSLRRATPTAQAQNGADAVRR